jgi:hypothetical protein
MLRDPAVALHPLISTRPSPRVPVNIYLSLSMLSTPLSESNTQGICTCSPFVDIYPSFSAAPCAPSSTLHRCHRYIAQVPLIHFTDAIDCSHPSLAPCGRAGTRPARRRASRTSTATASSTTTSGRPTCWCARRLCILYSTVRTDELKIHPINASGLHIYNIGPSNFWCAALSCPA